VSVEQPGCPPSDRVVVGVDGSERSQQALRWARPLAAAMGATVEVVAVVPPSPPRSYGDTDWVTAVPGDFDPDTHGHRVLTDTLEAAFGGQSPPELRSLGAAGQPGEGAAGISAGAGMLVVGARGRGGFPGCSSARSAPPAPSTPPARSSSCTTMTLHHRDSRWGRLLQMPTTSRSPGARLSPPPPPETSLP